MNSSKESPNLDESLKYGYKIHKDIAKKEHLFIIVKSGLIPPFKQKCPAKKYHSSSLVVLTCYTFWSFGYCLMFLKTSILYTIITCCRNMMAHPTTPKVFRIVNR